VFLALALTLIASAAMALIPQSIWFTDDFEGYLGL